MYRRVLKEAGDGARDRQIERAREAWYQGFVAEAIDHFCRHEKVLDSSGRRHGGLLTGDDLARWEVPVEAPLTFDYHGYTVAKGGPGARGRYSCSNWRCCRGSISTISIRSDPISSTSSSNAPSSPSPTARRGMATPILSMCRCAPCSAPHTTMRGDELVGDEASLELAARSPRWAHAATCWSVEKRRSSPGRDRRADDRRAASTSPLGMVAGDTCHIDVVDRWGNMVSATPSGGWLQSSPVIPELGVCLGSRMQMLWLEEGLPASLEPGKRPRSTLSPSMAFKDGEPYLAFGTPGGDQQDQWSVLMFLHHVHHGMNLQEAIDCPAFHNEHMPSSFYPRAATSRPCSRSKPVFRKRRVQSWRGAVIVCGSARPGRKAASPAAPARRLRKAPCSRPPPTRAACKATPSDGDTPASNLECRGR